MYAEACFALQTPFKWEHLVARYVHAKDSHRVDIFANMVYKASDNIRVDSGTFSMNVD